MDGIRIADLFCGVGGLSLGFQSANLDIALAIDNWEDAINVYKSNFDHPVINKDLSDHLSVSRILAENKINAIIGGPPCQDFSHAGKRLEGKRADLTASFSKVISNIKPLFFVMENVARTINSKTYKNAREEFKNAGYGVTEVILDASLCGVPQKRKRFFCIGFLNKPDNYLLEKIQGRLSHQPMTMRDYFGKSLSTDFYYRHPRNYSRRAIYSLDEPSATIRGVNRPIPPNYPGNNSDAASPSLARPLTTGERAQVQTFPKSFKWIGSKTNIEQMIGNAVPVNLGKFVAECVIEGLSIEGTSIYRPGFTRTEFDLLFVEKDEFIAWLIDIHKFSTRSASNVVSRVKRVSNYIDVFSPLSDDALVENLSNSLADLHLGVSVVSQLKRSLLLFREFIK